ncbi:MAG: radical SAM/SPASM domain-containing protein [Oceanidesulfovibrio sp.]
MGLLKRFSFPHLPGMWRARPRLDVVQVAVTTRCNAACVYCPRTVYSRQWVNQDLDPGLFHAMLPALAGAKRIHLQGWGEPFLHPHLVDFIRQAKEAGLRVSTTTNAAKIDPKLLSAAVEAGLDDLGLSLAGVTAEKNDAIRTGAPFEGVAETIARVREITHKRGGAGPTVRIAYLLLDSHKDSVFRLPALMAGLGVSEGVISALGFVPSWQLAEEECMLPRNKEQAKAARAFRRSMFKLSMAAAFQGINLFSQLPRLKRRRLCPENVSSTLVVGVDGSVSPCVMGHLPVRGNSYHWHAGEERLFTPLVFGDIADDSRQLTAVANGRARLSFLASFGKNPPPSCRQCVKLHMTTE